MKQLTSLLFLFCWIIKLNGQISCDSDWPTKNLRPDTLTTYLFSNKTVLINKIQGSKPTSNFSFKAKDFNLKWIPVNTSDINKFVESSLKSFGKKLDTLNCNVFNKNLIAVVTQSKGKNYVFMYQNIQGTQDILVADFRNKRKIQTVLTYISLNLQ